MKTKLFALVLLAGSTMFGATRLSIGVGVGGYGPGYYQPAPAYVVAPPYPGPGFVWVNGYYGGGRAWVPGYWSRRPYYAPRYGGYGYRDYGYGRDYRRDYRGYRGEGRRGR